MLQTLSIRLEEPTTSFHLFSSSSHLINTSYPCLCLQWCKQTRNMAIMPESDFIGNTNMKWSSDGIRNPQWCSIIKYKMQKGMFPIDNAKKRLCKKVGIFETKYLNRFVYLLLLLQKEDKFWNKQYISGDTKDSDISDIRPALVLSLSNLNI